MRAWDAYALQGVCAGGENLARRAVGDDAPVIKDDDVVCKLGDIVHRMRDNQQRGALFFKVLQQGANVLAAAGVKPRHGLVKHQDGLAHGKDPGQGDAALLAAGKREGRSAKQCLCRLKTGFSESARYAFANLVLVQTQIMRAKRNVLIDGLRKKLAFGQLRHVADLFSKARTKSKVCGVDAVYLDGAGKGDFECACELDAG